MYFREFLFSVAFCVVSSGLVSAGEIAVLERGPHHRVVRETRQFVHEDGRVEESQSAYTELRNGMHYQQNGAWLESQDLIEPHPNGAVAQRGPTKVIFSNNLNVAGAIDMLTPDNKRLRSTLIGVGGATGVPIGAVDTIVRLPDDSAPYNYSDMTGFVYVSSTFTSGIWQFVHEGCTANASWGRLTWTQSGTGVKVEVRAPRELADLTYPRNKFIEVQNGVSFTGVCGRYLEVRVTLWRNSPLDPTPVFDALTIDCPNE